MGGDFPGGNFPGGNFPRIHKELCENNSVIVLTILNDFSDRTKYFQKLVSRGVLQKRCS